MVDPPRSGLGDPVARALASAGAPRLTYVSCDPATLARDLVPLQAAGYRVEETHLVDLFPQTYHLETVVQLGALKLNGPADGKHKWGRAHVGDGRLARELSARGVPRPVNLRPLTPEQTNATSLQPPNRQPRSTAEFQLKPTRQPMLWAALLYSLGIIAGVHAWRPASWWVAAGVAFLAAGLLLRPPTKMAQRSLALGAFFLAGALHIQLRGPTASLDTSLSRSPMASQWR